MNWTKGSLETRNDPVGLNIGNFKSTLQKIKRLEWHSPEMTKKIDGVVKAPIYFALMIYQIFGAQQRTTSTLANH